MNSDAKWYKYYGDIPRTIDYPDISMYRMIKNTQEKYPDYIAYDFMGKYHTYTEFTEQIEICAKALVEEGVKIVTTGAGSPAKYMPMWKENDIKVIPVIASIAHAVKMQAAGADAIVAEGAESGGHVGELHTMPLIPQIVDAVTIPVIAAGGICDGRGAAAAFMLGADAVQVGTRFISATECNAHENYKDKLIKATEISTIVTGKSLGHPVRSLKTPFSRNFAKMESDPNVTPEEILAFGGGALRKAVQKGDPDGSYMAGECAGLVKRVEPAAAIVEDIILGAEKVIKEATGRLY